MGLSNTATPTYYGQFRDKVLRGEIPVNEEIGMEMERIDKLIANPDYYYDDGAINGFIRFCEGELTLTDGSPVVLLDTFKLWAEALLSWFYFLEEPVWEPYTDRPGGRFINKLVKKRLIKKQYLIVARGAAKSMYASFLQAYFLTIDTDTTHQITTAPTMRLADEVVSPFRTAIARSRGPLFKFLTDGSPQNTTGNRFLRQKLVSTKKGVENFLTNSLLEIRPMSVDKLQSIRPKVATIDEWLSGDVREDVIGAIEQGASKNENYVIVAMSSEGTVRNGAGDTMKMELMSILRNEYDAPQFSIWHYKLDSIDEVEFPSLWPKAQPNIGMTVSYETYQQDVDRLNKTDAAKNDILAKRFGIPMEGYTYFFSYEETQHPALMRFDPFRFKGMPCAMGADLSQGDDFCAFTFLFPLGRGEFGIKTRSYITTRTLNNVQGALRLKYEEFFKQGSLMVMEGNVLDMMEVYEDLDAHILKSQYEVLAVGYDPYNAREFIERWSTENSPYGIEKVIQGVKSESVPLGELKHLSEEGELLFDEQLFAWAMGNAITLEDTNGNRKLLKKRNDQKIDNVAAAMDAWIAYKLHKESFE